MAERSAIFLSPGDVRFGAAGARMYTLLGSCVAITLWHPGRMLGAMCHYLVPSRARSDGTPISGRYADEAVQLFLREMRRNRTQPHEYQAKMFGGGSQFPGGAIQVCEKNITAGLALLDAHGITLVARHLGGTGPRRIVFDVSTGDVWLSHRHRDRDPARSSS